MKQGQRRASEHASAGARERLLDATAAMLASGGPRAATSRALAAAAGENVGAITYYFGSKDGLIAATHTRAARSLIAPVVDELADRTTDAVRRLDWGRLRRMADNVLDNVVQHAGPGSVNISLAVLPEAVTRRLAESAGGSIIVTSDGRTWTEASMSLPGPSR